MTERRSLLRECGDCSECCEVLPIAELGKPSNTTCQHRSEAGCRIYGEHPAECQAYVCAWRQGVITDEEARPDKTGVLVDCEGGDAWIVVQECRPGAFDTPVGKAILDAVLGVADQFREGARIEPYGIYAGGRLGKMRRTGPKVYVVETHA